MEPCDLSHHLVTKMQKVGFILESWVFLGIKAFMCMMFPVMANAEPTIDFSTGSNLKAVYDAGLRPWRINPNERSILDLVDQRITVIAPGGGKFAMDVEIGSFSVLANHELGAADFVSQPMSLDEASRLVNDVAKALHIDVNVGAGMEGLEVKVDQMKRMRHGMPAPQYWNGRGISRGVRTSVSLTPLFGIPDLTPVRAKVNAQILFEKPGGITKSFGGPLTPPPGYEDVSMERPPRDPNQKPFPAPVHESTPTIPPRATSPTAAPKASPVVQTEPSKSFPWLWIIGSIFLLAAIRGILLKPRRR